MTLTGSSSLCVTSSSNSRSSPATIRSSSWMRRRLRPREGCKKNEKRLCASRACSSPRNWRTKMRTSRHSSSLWRNGTVGLCSFELFWTSGLTLASFHSSLQPLFFVSLFRASRPSADHRGIISHRNSIFRRRVFPFHCCLLVHCGPLRFSSPLCFPFPHRAVIYVKVREKNRKSLAFLSSYYLFFCPLVFVMNVTICVVA